MAVLVPFDAVRPSPEKAQAVAALPYDVVDRTQARQIGEKNPYSFLHVDRAEMDLEPDVDLYAPAVYAKAKENLDRMIREKILIRDPFPCYYIYELEREGRKQTGVVGCASVDDYLSGIVKKHELTREDKELDRIRHVDVCDANTGPIFLAASYPDELKKLLDTWQKTHPPVYDFIEEDSIAHRVWVIDERMKIERIRELFERIPAFYIADGHHRAASAVKVGFKRRQSFPEYDTSEAFNFFLSVVFPFDELTILAYHRVVKDLNGYSPGELIRELKNTFEVCPSAFPVRPVHRHQLGCYVSGAWYELTVRQELLRTKASQDPDLIRQLDVSILQERVLMPILGIEDPRTNPRIRFVGGCHETDELQAIADETGGIAFILYPTSMEELMQIADAGGLMPPKSTWFEPKLRSGLFVHPLS